MKSVFAHNHSSPAISKAALSGEILSLLNKIVPVHGSCFYDVDSKMVANHRQIDNLEESWLGAYQEYYFAYDPLHPSRYAEHHVAVATIHSSLESCDKKAQQYLVKFLIPQQTPYQLELYFRSAGRIIAGASLVRRQEMGRFSTEEVVLLERIVPFVELSIRSASAYSLDDRLARYGLSHREQEVVELVTCGLSNKEICRRLHIELPTVKTYMSRIFAKTGVRTRTALLHELFLAP